jgi:hypothetical protein
VAHGLIGGTVLAVILFIAVFATGSTFGQRCAKLHPEKGQAWQQCINDLKRG